MAFDHLGHEGVHGPRQAEILCNTSEHSGLLVERPLDGLNLPSDSPNPIEQFLLFFCGVSHKKLRR